ncbi:malate/L-lactate dehydrogenase domain-containing protein [Ditylenchus destructor]|nr:malate/L-lactate dehydrogenase domain-containing protein [Ditylenchus destructor]
MAFTNTSPLMFPNRSAQVGLGTNPISVVAPAERSGDNFALDMATTTVALGKVELAQRKGEKIPLQWGANSSGKVTDNPDEVVDGGALLPLGGAEETVLVAGDPERHNIERCEKAGGLIYGKAQLQHLEEIGQHNGVTPFTYSPLGES